MSQINRPESIPGYTHPESVVYTNPGVKNAYKTFTEGQKPKKKEKFGSTIGTGKYVKAKDVDGIAEDDMICPVCSDHSMTVCQCAFNDKKCSQGHIWYTNRAGEIKVGNPH